MSLMKIVMNFMKVVRNKKSVEHSQKVTKGMGGSSLNIRKHAKNFKNISGTFCWLLFSLSYCEGC